MKFPDSIARVTIELTTGQWVSLTLEDLRAAESFSMSTTFWPLLVFIAGLQAMPETEQEAAK